MEPARLGWSAVTAFVLLRGISHLILLNRWVTQRRDAGKPSAVFAVARMVGGNILHYEVGKFLWGGQPTTGHMASNRIITPQGDPPDICDPMGNPVVRDKGG